MATESLNNPFAGYGNIVADKSKFVGRQNELKQIEQRVLGKEYGNLAIMGLPRVGKSSLAWQAVMNKKEELIKERTIPIFLTLSTMPKAILLLKKMVSELHDEIILNYDDDKYKNLPQKIYEETIKETDEYELKNLIQRYFKFIKRLNYKVIYVLDEFDGAKEYNVADFQYLRELSYNPETKICLITTSRKTIKEIEAQNGAISNFNGIFKDLRLGVYSEEDMQLYWQRTIDIFNPDDEYKRDAEYYVGRHPFLLDFFNYNCYSKGITTKIPETAFSELKVTLLEQFETIEKTLKNEKLLNKAIELVLGPVYDVKIVDIEKLLKYDIIKTVDSITKNEIFNNSFELEEDKEYFVCFSDYFSKYIYYKYRTSIPYWPLWTKTEKMLRTIVEIYLKELFGDDWEACIETKYSSNATWLDKFNKLKALRTSYKRDYANAGDNLLEYTTTRELYSIFISTDKSWFIQNVFTDDKPKDLEKKFQKLANVRNPFAHNSSEIVSEADIARAKQFCSEIIKAIEAYIANSI